MHPRRLTSIALIGLAYSPGATASAQESAAPPLESPPTASIMRAAHGAALVEGQLWGVGPGYKVLFREGGFEFHPALGAAAPHNLPLGFELESIERGGVVVYAPAAPASPALDEGGVVRYAHPSGIEERYEMRADGVEQSFVFTEPLPGAGELVVRGRLATELVAPHGERAELDFALLELGGVRIGAVNALDSAGSKARGSLRHDGGTLELVLPAEFVDAAEYPLVLDPLVGTTFDIGSGFFTVDASPDVAYLDGYLVAWQRQYSSTDIDILAQLVEGGSGGLSGDLIPVTTSLVALDAQPTLATAGGRFLLAWERDDLSSVNIKACYVNFSGGLSEDFTISNFPEDEWDPDAGGVQDNDGLVVWERQGAGIYGAVGLPSGWTTFLITDDPRARHPAIAKSGGPLGRSLVTYQVDYSLTDPDVYVALLGSDGALLAGPQALADSVDWQSAPDVDGDGGSWIVAYQYLTNRIACRRVTYDPGGLIYGPEVEISPGDDTLWRRQPAVAWTRTKTYVAWDQVDYALPFGDDSEVCVMGIDTSDCGACEAAVVLPEGPSVHEFAIKLASQYSGGSPADGVLATWCSANWSEDGFLTDGEIMGQLLEAMGFGGTVTNLGGHCAFGGVISMKGSPIAVGNPDFAVTLSDAPSMATTGWLMISPAVANPFVCGSCKVIISGSIMVPVTNGSAEVSLPLPCDLNLVNAEVDAQWLVYPTGAFPCFLASGVSASDRLRFKIGQ